MNLRIRFDGYNHCNALPLARPGPDGRVSPRSLGVSNVEGDEPGLGQVQWRTWMIELVPIFNARNGSFHPIRSLPPPPEGCCHPDCDVENGLLWFRDLARSTYFKRGSRWWKGRPSKYPALSR